MMWQDSAQMTAIRLRLASLGVFIPLLFLIPQRTSAAQEAPKDTAEWLTRASELTNIQQAGTRPFKLRAKVRMLGGKEQMYEGTFELLWNSPSQWREELQLPGYSRLRVGADHK